MVVENELGNLVGYCVADPNIANYIERYSNYLSTLREKYPKVTNEREVILSFKLKFPFPLVQVIQEEGALLTPCEELLLTLEDEPEELPEIIVSYPATIALGVLPNLLDDSITKRLLTCVLASLRTQGTFGGNVVVKSSEKNTVDLYNRLGFREVATRGSYLYLGRGF